MPDTQTVVTEPDVQDKAPVTEAVSDVQEQEIDLDKLLEEFIPEEEPTVAKEPVKDEDATINDKDDTVTQWVKSQMEASKKQEQERTAKDIDDLVSKVKGDLPVSQTMARGYLEQRARENPLFAAAFANRHKNPAAYAKIVEKVSQEFKSELKKIPDGASTSTRSAVAEAIQTAKSSNSQVVEKPMHQLTDYEFNLELERAINS